ncbi:hypothetical protein D6D18_03919 [Aureobasidium pullulans]|nr:hypothetical protein D6D18_03919 [Aureobasidium pullulans]
MAEMAAEAPQDYAPTNLDPGNDDEAFGNLASGARDRIALNFLRWVFRRPNPSRSPAKRRGLLLTSRRHTWRPVYKNKPLGRGGNSLVHLWVCTDDQQRIVDRVIVKECVPGQATYNDARFWKTGVGGGVGTEPRECVMANRVYDSLRVNSPGDERHATQCLGWGHLRNGGPRLWGYKLYFNYCEHGDLSSLIYSQAEGHRRDRRQRSRIDRPRIIYTTPPSPVIFPEGFLWHMFESLAKVLVQMRATETLHGDMQAANVLFSAPNPDRFKIWPTPMLADWGTARTLDAATRARTGALDESICLPFASPEQACDDTFSNWEVPNLTFSAKTNVWQLGMLMCCAMRLTRALPEAVWRGVDPEDLIEPNSTEHLDFSKPDQRNVREIERDGAGYSPELVSLVRKCLSFHQINRPSPANLLAEIQRNMVGRMNDMDTRTTPVPWNHPARLVMRLRNEWSIGSSFDPDFPVPHYPEPDSDSDSDYQVFSDDQLSSDDGAQARPRDQYNLRN